MTRWDGKVCREAKALFVDAPKFPIKESQRNGQSQRELKAMKRTAPKRQTITITSSRTVRHLKPSLSTRIAYTEHLFKTKFCTVARWEAWLQRKRRFSDPKPKENGLNPLQTRTKNDSIKKQREKRSFLTEKRKEAFRFA